MKPRQRRDGSVYSVFFRERDPATGRTAQTSMSWNDYEDAEHCRQLIDQVGPEKAREIMRIVQSPRKAETVAQFLTKHVDHLAGVEPGTLARYRAYIRNDIAPIADIPLAALSRDDVARWVNGMKGRDGGPPSGKTVANKHGFLDGALNAAVRGGKIEANPCDGNRLPRWDREEMVFLERDEFRILIDAAPDYWRTLVEPRRIRRQMVGGHRAAAPRRRPGGRRRPD